ncbi:STAS domain-containing protein [Streptacidiphilus sp. N1-12]|uniref:Anti-sigma factor antagonist n=2 Tax=Streptacidiphilus alkalitolerans TaxID=3342712 RepID=A0ABV6WPW0_9ACTN
MLPLTFRCLTTGTGPLVEVVGALDFETAQDFHDLLPTLALLPGQRLVLDLGAVEFFDSSGIRALLAARRLAAAGGGDLALAAVPDHIVRVLDAVGLADHFTIATAPPQ